MSNDPISRRTLLKAGLQSAALAGYASQLIRAASISSPSTTALCTLNHEQTIGPYYLAYEMVRKDITEGHSGIPLKLRVQLMDVTKCRPLKNAAVDVWHCDASGIYSGFVAQSTQPMPGIDYHHRPEFGAAGRPPGPPMGPPGGRARPTDKTTFLRGVQLSDDDGVVEFATIYPGWYMGRTTHIHLEVHLDGSVANAKYSGGHVAHIGQLFFPEAITGQVALLDPYVKHQIPRMSHREDNIFTGQHGSESMVELALLKTGSLNSGLAGSVVLGVDPTATHSDHELGPGGEMGPPPGPPGGWGSGAPPGPPSPESR